MTHLAYQLVVLSGYGLSGRLPTAPEFHIVDNIAGKSGLLIVVLRPPLEDKRADSTRLLCTTALHVSSARPSGKIDLAKWTPDGFIGQVFKTLGKHLPPPAGVMSPALWGTEELLWSCQVSISKSLSRDGDTFLRKSCTSEGRY